MALDRDVLKFFRSMGGGVSAAEERGSAQVHARLAGVIRGTETFEHQRRAGSTTGGGERPMWGDTGRALGDGQALAADELEAERMPLFAERAKLRGLEG